MNLTGGRLGAYDIGEQIGSGGMGTVYRATGPDGETVAIKVVHPQIFGLHGVHERFLREAQIGQRVRHKNVVRALDADEYEHEGEPVRAIVMEYVEGQTLAELRDELGHLPEELCRHVGREIAAALEAIHAVGAVHRDLKPSNVLITQEQEIKVMDLGVALLADASLRLSRTGEFLGSILYAAPEQFDAERAVDARTDLYGLGILLFELATGRHPFRGGDAVLAPAGVRTRETPDAALVNPELSPFLAELIHYLLANDIEERPASAAVVARLLEQGEASRWWQELLAKVSARAPGTPRRLPIPRDAGVHGRDAEIDRLSGLFAQAIEGHGRVVLIEGEAGIGKTRLVDEFVARQAGALNFLYGNNLPGGAATPIGAFASAVRSHFGDVDLAEALRTRMASLTALVPAYAALLRGDPVPAGADQLDASGLRAAFLQVVRGLAEERPTVLFIDDLHLAPADALALFAAIGESAADLPLLLIGAMRPGQHEDWAEDISAAPHVERMQLGRLGAKDLTALLADLFQSDQLANELAWDIARKSDGNPLFAFEIVRELRERQRIVKRDDGSYTLTGVVGDIDTPASVRELVGLRLRHLDEAEQDLLDLAACYGNEFDPSVVAEAAGEKLVPALKRLRNVQRMHRLIRPSGRLYVFDHHEVREALYEMLHVQLREEYHAALADVLAGRAPAPTGEAAVRIARHKILGRRASDTLAFLPEALNHLKRTHAHQQRIEFAAAVLDEGVEMADEKRVRLLLHRGDAARFLGRAEERERSAAQALEIAQRIGDELLVARAAIQIGTARYAVSDSKGSEEYYAMARTAACAAGDSAIEGDAERGLGLTAMERGDYDAARTHSGRALAIAEELGDSEALSSVNNNLGLLNERMGAVDEAEQCYLRAIDFAHSSGRIQVEARARANLGRIYFQRGELARALEEAELYRDGMRAVGDRGGEVMGRIITCAIWRNFGALDKLERELEYARLWARETGQVWMESHTLNSAAWIARQRGDRDEHERLARAALALREKVDAREGIADSSLELAEALLDRGDPDSARPLLRRAIELGDVHSVGAAVVARCHLALLGDLTLEEAETALEGDQAGTLTPENRMSAHEILSRVPGGERHLAIGREILQAHIATVPEEYRKSCREQIASHRALLR